MPVPSPEFIDETRPPPACPEIAPDVGPWPRAAPGAAGLPRAVRAGEGELGYLEQRFAEPSPSGARAAELGPPARLKFLGAHLFDLLQKVAYEGGSTEDARRRLICAALNAAAARGAPVLRIWGTLKRTGTSAELARAADALELVLDENARRARPLRFVIVLLNHQAGYGSPRPQLSLDDQDPSSPWHASQIYRGGSWRREGAGLLGERIAVYRSRPKIQRSADILVWELVNELDTYRSVAGGSFSGPEAEALRETFITPAVTLLAESFPQPIAVGDLRGVIGKQAYLAFARSIVAGLPEAIRGRLVWTSHAYVTAPADRSDDRAPSMASKRAGAQAGSEALLREWARATAKLDVDLAFAAEAGLPFFVGEIGQQVKGIPARFCADGPRHDIEALLRTVLEPTPEGPQRAAIEAAIFWGEGECHLEVRDGERTRIVQIGAGGDSADLGPNETRARAEVQAARRRARFRVALPTSR